jgi:hypothetical protein
MVDLFFLSHKKKDIKGLDSYGTKDNRSSEVDGHEHKVASLFYMVQLRGGAAIERLEMSRSCYTSDLERSYHSYQSPHILARRCYPWIFMERLEHRNSQPCHDIMLVVVDSLLHNHSSYNNFLNNLCKLRPPLLSIKFACSPPRHNSSYHGLDFFLFFVSECIGWRSYGKGRIWRSLAARPSLLL